MHSVPEPFRLRSALRLLGCGIIGTIAPSLVDTYFPTDSDAIAQLIPDDTLGDESSLVVPDTTINGNPATQIDGGAARGETLFHSFEQFNVGKAQSVYFASPEAISIILNRVTGDRPSNISGTLGIEGSADLFFINPNGIVFGSNARLDTRGSAIFSSAESVLLEDGFEFSASNPQALPLLTVSSPVGLQYGVDPGDLLVQGDGNNLFRSGGATIVDERPVGLAVDPNRTLALLGGNLSFVGGNATVENGRLELGSLAAGQSVDLAPVASGWALAYEAVEPDGFQDIQFTAAASASSDGSDVQIVGQNISLVEGSAVVTDTSTTDTEGRLTIQASEAVSLTGDVGEDIPFLSGLYAQSTPDSTGNIQDLTIVAEQLSLIDRGQIIFINSGDGEGGDINIQAQGVQLQEGGFIAASTNGRGSGGNVDIRAQQVQLSSGSQIFADTTSSGSGGTITINAEQTEVSGFFASNGILSALSVGSSPPDGFEGAGDAGSLRIISDSLLVQNGAAVFASTSADGAGGNISIQSQEVQLEDASFIAANTSNAGSGGNIDIQAQQIQLKEIGIINAGTSGSGRSGEVTVQADSLQVLSGSQIATGTSGSGDSGDLLITARTIELGDFSTFNQTPSGLLTTSIPAARIEAGNAGNLTIVSDELRLRDESEISSGTASGGKGGDINITADSQLIVRDGATIGVNAVIGRNSIDTGAAGNLTVVSDSALLDGGIITAETESGNGGGISLLIEESLLLRNGSTISSTAGTAKAGGDGGNINIDAGFIVALAEENSDITANAFEGRGGQVSISTDGLLGIEVRDRGTPESDITASSEVGQSGIVTINAPDTEISAEEVQLPNTLADESDRVGQSLCSGEGNRFTASGRGGLPTSPYETLRGETLWEDWYVSSERVASSEIQQAEGLELSADIETEAGDAIVEARGWQLDPSGEIALVAAVASEQAISKEEGFVNASADCYQLKESLSMQSDGGEE